jgi:hypothetical protein
MTETAQPTTEEASALLDAVGANFPRCNCYSIAGGRSYTCPAHAFLRERPRGLARRWQVLLFYRHMAPRLLREEGFALETPPPSERGVLPW